MKTDWKTKTKAAVIVNWQPTIIGAVLAALVTYKELVIEGSVSQTNVVDWLIPVLIAALGAVSRTAWKSSQDSGIRE